MVTAKRPKEREVDRQKHPEKHVDLSRNADPRNYKDTTTNNRICQYLLVCPLHAGCYIYICSSVNSLERPSEIGGIISFLLLRTLKLSEVNNLYIEDLQLQPASMTWPCCHGNADLYTFSYEEKSV